MRSSKASQPIHIHTGLQQQKLFYSLKTILEQILREKRPVKEVQVNHNPNRSLTTLSDQI